MITLHYLISFFFFFNDTATTEIYTLSLHDALPISSARTRNSSGRCSPVSSNWSSYLRGRWRNVCAPAAQASRRSEEHTSELQSRLQLVCRLLLEKKKKKHRYDST